MARLAGHEWLANDTRRRIDSWGMEEVADASLAAKTHTDEEERDFFANRLGLRPFNSKDCGLLKKKLRDSFQNNHR